MIFKKYLLHISFLISIVATSGSLFFSEVMQLPPCLLCWYQRICMYPLVVIFGLGLLKADRQCFTYAFPMIILGFLTSIYHNLLYYKLIPESITPCTQGISCTTVQIEWMGFITIPLLSLYAFLMLFIFALKNFVNLRKEKMEYIVYEK